MGTNYQTETDTVQTCLLYTSDAADEEDRLMLPDEMEAEKNRKFILAQADEIEILKRNVRDLQEQLTAAHIKIKDLTETKEYYLERY